MQIKNILAKKKFFNITLESDIIRQIKLLAAQQYRKQNELIEEAIQDVLKKYKESDRP